MKITWLSKLNPNEKLRNWSKARTFGGTTKEKSLYIMGLRRKTFYIVACGVSTLVVAIAVGGGLGLHFFIEGLKDDTDLGVIVGITTTYTRDDGIVTTEVRSSTSIVDDDGGGTPTSSNLDQSSSSSTSSTITSSVSSTSSSASTSSTSSAAGGDPPAGGEYFKGEGTFYAPGIGSCGIESTEDEFVAALSRILFDADNNGNANNNPNCNRKIFIRNPAGSRKRGLDGRLGLNHSEGIWNFATSWVGSNSESSLANPGVDGIDAAGSGKIQPLNATIRYSYSTFGEAGASSHTLLQNGTINEAKKLHTRNLQRNMKHQRKLNLSSQSHIIQNPQNMNSIPQNQKILDTVKKVDTTLPSRPYYHVDQPHPTITLNSYLPQLVKPTPAPIKLQNRQVGNGGITITVVDRCPACAQYDLDLAPAAFNVIGDVDEGRIDIEWRWLD